MDPISAALGLGTAVVGGIMGSQPQSTETKPWKAQRPYLKDVFGNAQSNYDNRMGPYTGGLYAGMDPATAQGIQGIQGFSPMGQQGAMNAMNAGQGMYGAGNASMQANMGLTNQGDPTQANIASATAYANNPATQGMIDAANRDGWRNLSEQQLPGVDRNASISDNTNSSRTGMREAMLTRAQGDRASDVSAGIRGAQFDRGLALAEGARGTNLGAQQAGAAGLGANFNAGINAGSQGQQDVYNNLDAMVKSGQMSQADAQGYLSQAFQQYNMADNYDNEKLAAYQGMVNGDYGGQKTSGGGINGVMQGITGGGTAGLGLYSAYQKAQQPPRPQELRD